MKNFKQQQLTHSMFKKLKTFTIASLKNKTFEALTIKFLINLIYISGRFSVSVFGTNSSIFSGRIAAPENWAIYTEITVQITAFFGKCRHYLFPKSTEKFEDSNYKIQITNIYS